MTRLIKVYKKTGIFSQFFQLLLFDEVADHSSFERAGEGPGGLVAVEGFDQLASANDLELGDSGLGGGVDREHGVCLSALAGDTSRRLFAPFHCLHDTTKGNKKQDPELNVTRLIPNTIVKSFTIDTSNSQIFPLLNISQSE